MDLPVGCLVLTFRILWTWCANRLPCRLLKRWSRSWLRNASRSASPRLAPALAAASSDALPNALSASSTLGTPSLDPSCKAGNSCWIRRRVASHKAFVVASWVFRRTSLHGEKDVRAGSRGHFVCSTQLLREKCLELRNVLQLLEPLCLNWSGTFCVGCHSSMGQMWTYFTSSSSVRSCFSFGVHTNRFQNCL